MTETNKEYLTKTETAKLFNVSTKTIEKWVSEKSMPCSRIDDVLRFNRKKIEKWFEHNQPFKNINHFTAIIEKEKDLYVAYCPELDVASQGESVEESKANLQEAVELFLETASSSEIEVRLSDKIFITSLEVAFG